MASTPPIIKRYGRKYYQMTVDSEPYNIPIALLEYATTHGVTKTTIRNRLRYGWTIKKACTEGIINDKNSRT